MSCTYSLLVSSWGSPSSLSCKDIRPLCHQTWVGRGDLGLGRTTSSGTRTKRQRVTQHLSSVCCENNNNWLGTESIQYLDFTTKRKKFQKTSHLALLLNCVVLFLNTKLKVGNMESVQGIWQPGQRLIRSMLRLKETYMPHDEQAIMDLENLINCVIEGISHDPHLSVGQLVPLSLGQAQRGDANTDYFSPFQRRGN